MLLTSAVKSISTNDAKPRAINFLTRRTGRYSRLSRPRASEQGTPVIFYSPAMVDRSLTVDVAIIFDKFSEPAFQAIGRAFSSAAGVPIFLAHSVYLLAAGEIARIAGSAGEALFDGKPVLDISETIDLELPGASRTAAGFMLVTPADVDTIEPSFRVNYHVSEHGVVDNDGQPYAGDMPYVVLSVDGTQRDDLSSFTPTAASAAVLSRFFGVRDGQSLSLDPLLDALKLYNDFTFRSEVDRIDKRLLTMPEGAEKTALKQKREALLKNIVTDILKPAP